MNANSQKLVIVSNRLPISVSKENGKLVYKKSDGGLATGLGSVGKPKDKLWIGWPGIDSDQLTTIDRKEITDELKKHDCLPVFLTERQMKYFYFGYSNATIWPLFHYFTQHIQYQKHYWTVYQEVNKIFYREVIKHISKDTRLWIHDYQLMLLPQLVREKKPNSSIGFFLHIPFPSFEIFRLLPNRAAVLRGMLGADLIGFHTYSYVRHFLSSTLRILGHKDNLGLLNIDHRIIRADAFPIGIDYPKFAAAHKKMSVKKMIQELRKIHKGQQIILSLDRLDYSKGMLERLKAYDYFLAHNPKYVGKVVMIMIAIPSRMKVHAYQDLRKEIEQAVSRINGKYAKVGWSPISYQYQSIPFDQLIALYCEAATALITPLRDGMNLVAKEYVAANQKGNAALILSEMAGAASELPEAILVNPNNKESVAKAIKDALEMPLELRKQNMKFMQARISSYDVKRWAKDFIDELDATKEYQNERLHRHLTRENRRLVTKQFKKATKRLFLLDYDGTLVGLAQDHAHSSAIPPKTLRKLLSKLHQSDNDEVVIVSGRPKEALEGWFGDLPITLVAEHGGWVKENGKWEQQKKPTKDWKKIVRPIIEKYIDRTAGSFIEEKDFALVWHYRKVSPSLAGVRKAELRHDIQQAIKNIDIDLYEGNKIFEIKPKSIHKGTIAEVWASRQKWDFILAIGDDYTDEDMFTALPQEAFTIRVGFETSESRFHVGTTAEVINLLDELANK